VKSSEIKKTLISGLLWRFLKENSSARKEANGEAGFRLFEVH
jgi:hypothetical protein